jgi:hypothetical protein
VKGTIKYDMAFLDRYEDILGEADLGVIATKKRIELATNWLKTHGPNLEKRILMDNQKKELEKEQQAKQKKITRNKKRDEWL